MKRTLTYAIVAVVAVVPLIADIVVGPRTPGPIIPHTRVVPDHVHATADGLFEFATVVAPPGTNGCNGGRTFTTGSANLPGVVEPHLYRAALLCSSANCATDEYTTKIANVAAAGLKEKDFVKNDVVMTRRRNGDLLIARVVRRELPQQRFGIMIWGSSDCGGSWSSRAFIDPSDTRWDAQGRYGKPRENFKGGWDRQELYADPFSDDVFLTVNGTGGKSPDGINNMLLFRSSDGGIEWKVKVLSAGQTAPVMMTSLPGGRIVFADRVGPTPRIRWSVDGGVTLSKAHDVFWNDGTGAPTKGSANSFATRPVGEEGSIGISRIGHTVVNGKRVNRVRVSYPSLLNGKQVLRIIAVFFGEDGSAPTVQNVRTIDLPADGGLQTNLIQATVVQADPTLIGNGATDDTTLIYWRAVSKPITVAGIGSTRLQGALIRGKDTISPVFALATDDAGKSRSWAGGFFGNDVFVGDSKTDTNSATYKTGDYSKGGFYFDKTANELRYWVQWVETDITGKHRTIHGTVIGVPR